MSEHCIYVPEELARHFDELCVVADIAPPFHSVLPAGGQCSSLSPSLSTCAVLRSVHPKENVYQDTIVLTRSASSTKYPLPSAVVCPFGRLEYGLPRGLEHI